MKISQLQLTATRFSKENNSGEDDELLSELRDKVSYKVKYLYANSLRLLVQKLTMMPTTVGCSGEQVLSCLVWCWSNPHYLDILGCSHISRLCPIGI